MAATRTGDGAASFDLGASASFGASTGGDASAIFEASPCGADAANRSLNISGVIEATVSGFEIAGAGSGRAATTFSTAADALRAATLAGRLITGASKLALLSCG
jgi:hypothetical protein